VNQEYIKLTYLGSKACTGHRQSRCHLAWLVGWAQGMTVQMSAVSLSVLHE